MLNSRVLSKCNCYHYDNAKDESRKAMSENNEVESIGWLAIDSAPKGATAENPCNEHWILGTDGRDCKVIRWCMEYPCSDGVWMYGYAPSDYIDGILEFNPTHWMALPSLPNASVEASPE